MEKAVGDLKVLSWHLPGETEKNHLSFSQSEMRSQMFNRNENHSSVTFSNLLLKQNLNLQFITDTIDLQS